MSTVIYLPRQQNVIHPYLRPHVSIQNKIPLFGWTPEEVNGGRRPFVPDSEKEETFAIIKGLLKHSLDSGQPS